MRTISICISLALFLTAATAFGAQPNMQAGMWEITIKMDMERAPFPMPPMTVKQCVTKDDLKDGRKTLPSSSNKKDDCEVTDYKAAGNKVSWKMLCKNGGSGTGEMVYQGTSYNGTMTMTQKDKKGGTAKIVQHYKGKRTGECK